MLLQNTKKNHKGKTISPHLHRVTTERPENSHCFANSPTSSQSLPALVASSIRLFRRLNLRIQNVDSRE